MNIEELEERFKAPIDRENREALESLLGEADCPSLELLLSYSVLEKKLEAVKLLLLKGANPNKADPYQDGCSLLWWLALHRERGLLETLVEAGATVLGELENTSVTTDDSALHIAADRGDVDLIRYLVKEAKGAEAFLHFDTCDFSPLHSAVNAGSLEATAVLLGLGHDPNALVQVHRGDRIGYTPLSWAVSSGHYEISKLLLEHGADPDRPGFMWTTARDRLDKLEGNAAKQFAELLEVKPLKKLKDSSHLAEVERQLLADLRYHGFGELQLKWRGSRVCGDTVQIAGERLAPCEKIKLLGPDGMPVGNGQFSYISLTVELEFRVFWTYFEVQGEQYAPGKGTIPGHIWEGLTQEQKSWIVMDCRNEMWRGGDLGRILVDGEI